MKHALLVCVLLTGCTAANRHWSETAEWAADLTYYQFCVQSAITSPNTDKGRLLLNELRRRQARGAFDIEDCVTIGSARAREIAEFKASTDAFFRGVGTVIGVGLAAGIVGAAGYYGGRAPVAPYVPPLPARQPVPAVVPYVPIPLSYPLLTQFTNQAFTQKTCAYSGTQTVILMQPHESCPASVPR